ncbi:hypothetical protein DFH07DRAFT_826249 [Mycena maculata]|uniref:DUF6533 domain-containing protein n=1 Tax=Mycena maculata TaxID=230809 RepID=A0AAD7IYT9_9AGAR|nr:hypothetical protein DFH07DRAFT_826249 [Mycena maculata]
MDDAAVTQRARDLILLDCLRLVGITFLYYDHLITLGDEINLLWRRGKSLSSYCFFANRYFAFFSGIPIAALPFMTFSTAACMQYRVFQELSFVAMQIITDVIMMIRVYALFGRSRRILWLIIAAGASVVGIAVWSMTSQQAGRSKIVGGCHFNLDTSTAHRLAGPWEGLFMFDSLIFGLTAYKMTRVRMAFRTSIYMLVVRDGALYFGIVALSNLANIATYYVSLHPSLCQVERGSILRFAMHQSSGPFIPGSLATMSNYMSVTMISRLILNLHQHANVGITSEMTASQSVEDDFSLSSLADLFLTQADSVPPPPEERASAITTNAGD